MKFQKEEFISFSLIIFCFIYFFIGFYFQHDFSNGGKIDFDHIFKNFRMFKENSVFNIDWNKYESTSLPLHYLITKFIIPINNIFIFKFYTFVISLICVLILYFSLKLKLELFNNSHNVFLISSILLLSSSFRTDAFYGLEENTGFLFFLISSFLFIYSQKKNNFFIKFLCILFSCLTFYTRQTYAFLPIIVYFYYFDKKNIISKNNFRISILFIFFLLPSLYFFYQWGAPVPDLSGTKESRLVPFQYYSIPKIFGMYIIFTLPFLIFSYFSSYKNFFLSRTNYKYFFAIIIFLLIYIILFWKIAFISFGGGPLYKLFIGNNFIISKVLYLALSFFGLLSIIYLSKKNISFLIYISITTFIYLFADTPFFSYLDPLMFLTIILFTKNFDENIVKNSLFSKFLFLYFIILHLGWIYYYKYILDGIIR